MRESVAEGPKGVDRAWAWEGCSRGRLSELETAVNSTPMLQYERGEGGSARTAIRALGEALTCEPRQRGMRWVIRLESVVGSMCRSTGDGIADVDFPKEGEARGWIPTSALRRSGGRC